MITIKQLKDVSDFDVVVHAARNSWGSWENSDSGYVNGEYVLGDNDYALLAKLCKAGSDHRKAIRFANVFVDITAPLSWWKQMDTYRVGTVCVSTSTMHTLARGAITPDMFTLESRDDEIIAAAAENMYNTCESFRQLYLRTNDKKYWRALIDLLPEGFMQTRTLMLNYEVLHNAYHSRRGHRLTEWHDFCDWVETLPYSDLITGTRGEADES